MARPRVPSAYGLFQFVLRVLVFVVETCGLAALATLSRYGEHFPLGYVTVRHNTLFGNTAVGIGEGVSPKTPPPQEFFLC
jgi:hypothetical protein